MLTLPAVSGCKRLPLLLLVAALVALLAPAPVYSHGSLTLPRSRNVVNPIQGLAWWKDHGNGQGKPAVKPLNGPGVCGDPFQEQTDTTLFFRSPGAVQATYTAGATINVQWWIQVNHGGRIGIKLCNRRNNIDQACFNQFQLQRADGQGPYVYIMGGTSGGTLGTMSAQFRLPAGVSCTDGGCVLQWEYLTMNSCFEPCPKPTACGDYASLRNPVTNQFNMPTCCVGFSCNPLTVPEIFRNCADVAITPGTTTVTPPPPPPSTVTPPASPTTCSRTAALGGACGGGTCCSSGQCCSQWGFCGATSQHCSTGCQRSYGSCWAAAAAARTLGRRAGLPRAAAVAAAAAGATTTTAATDEVTSSPSPALVVDASPAPDAEASPTPDADVAAPTAAAAPAGGDDAAAAAAEAPGVAAADAPAEPVAAEQPVTSEEPVTAAGSP